MIIEEKTITITIEKDLVEKMINYFIHMQEIHKLTTAELSCIVISALHGLAWTEGQKFEQVLQQQTQKLIH